MSPLCRLLVCNVLLAWLLSACSTPGNRAHNHAAALHRLSPADQQLVLHGHIRPGIDQEAVYIAWGAPDEKRSGSEGKSAPETWIYRQRVTLYEPMNSYVDYGPYHGFGDDATWRGFLPGYTYGGVGYEGALRYQPHVRSLDSVRIAEFSSGTVDRYKGADGTWSQPSRAVAAPRRSPAVSLTARHVDRRLSSLVRYSAKPNVAHAANRFGIQRAKHAALRKVSPGAHRQQHVGNMGKEKKSGFRTAAVHGSRTGSERSGTHIPQAGHGAHHAGHAHLGSSGKHRPRAA